MFLLFCGSALGGAAEGWLTGENERKPVDFSSSQGRGLKQQAARQQQDVRGRGVGADSKQTCTAVGTWLEIYTAGLLPL